MPRFLTGGLSAARVIPGGPRSQRKVHRFLPSLLGVHGKCSFAGLGCCSCHVCVCVGAGGVVLCRCVCCVWPVDLFHVNVCLSSQMHVNDYPIGLLYRTLQRTVSTPVWMKNVSLSRLTLFFTGGHLQRQGWVGPRKDPARPRHHDRRLHHQVRRRRAIRDSCAKGLPARGGTCPYYIYDIYIHIHIHIECMWIYMYVCIYMYIYVFI